MELYFEISPKLQSWIRILCTSLLNIIKYIDYELLVPYNVISKPLLYLPKRKKKSSFDNCFQKLLVKSEAQQGRCVYVSKPSQRGLPHTALSQAGHPSGWSLDEVMRCRGLRKSKVFSLTCEDKIIIQSTVCQFTDPCLQTCVFRPDLGILVELLTLHCLLADSADDQF